MLQFRGTKYYVTFPYSFNSLQLNWRHWHLICIGNVFTIFANRQWFRCLSRSVSTSREVKKISLQIKMDVIDRSAPMIICVWSHMIIRCSVTRFWTIFHSEIFAIEKTESKRPQFKTKFSKNYETEKIILKMTSWLAFIFEAIGYTYIGPNCVDVDLLGQFMIFLTWIFYSNSPIFSNKSLHLNENLNWKMTEFSRNVHR